jgi:hypothetical protein
VADVGGNEISREFKMVRGGCVLVHGRNAGY